MRDLNNIIQLLSSPARNTPATLSGVKLPVAAYLAAQTIHKSQKPLIFITPSESQALLAAQDLKLFTDLPVYLFPGYEIPAYTPLSPDPQTTAIRLEALYNIRTATSPFIVVSASEALLRKVMPGKVLTQLAEIVISGEEVNLDTLVKRLITAGYEKMSLVQNAGEISQRGDILDIFPPGFDCPIRCDFFGDYIESLRLFDPISQRSIDEIEEAEIIPVSEILYLNEGSEKIPYDRLHDYSRQLKWDRDEIDVLGEKIHNNLKFPGIEFFLPVFHESLSDPLSYMPEDHSVFMLYPHEITRSVQLVWERINTNYDEACQAQTAIFPPEHLFISEQDLHKRLLDTNPVRIVDFEEVDLHRIEGEQVAVNCGNHTLLKQHLKLQRKKHGLLAPLTRNITDWIDHGDQVHIACRSEKHAGHLAQMLENKGLSLEIISGIASFTEYDITKSHITLYTSPLSEGFDLLDEKIHFLSEHELFGETRLTKSKQKKRHATGPPVNFEELNIGDIVVHIDHGLGVYDGIVNIALGKIANDFLLIVYKNNDKLYVPVDCINTVSKYSGLSDKKPVISSLGSKKWQTAKKKVQEAVWKVAQDLLVLYARRKLNKGIVFSQPDSLYDELEESFPYEETQGQSKTIKEVLGDLTSSICMDRLVCGDVGFGKTEVALRAAFKVLCDSYQVAVLVPTTVLAEQHAQTFKDRFQGFPVNIACLNRFRSRAEQRQILKDLEEGRVDIVIGTHRILSKDVIFKQLGLLIIDEEHRFGVTHKERLKKMRAGIDVLTLTATPIPRTLQMSLLGVRDLSLISTPPQNRRSVKTFIAKYDDLVIKEAVIRELQRSGQVFLVHNRVRSIHDIAFKVQNLVPDARIAVAHGQMPGKVLEDIMVSFIRRDVDVLICTTIIESGLDIPNANTIIINRADRMGLAEIYQLRGRVGRSTEQAYAYLLVPSLEHISKDAQQRLRALMEYNELGGGFKLALSDLQIRGGGNILGETQSGNIAAVGYDLYLDLLQKTIEDLKRKSEDGYTEDDHEQIDPEINLTLSAFIPEKYVPDPNQRYIAYRRISGIASAAELQNLEDEFIDRYGELPEETKNLFLVVSLKEDLKQLKIIKLEQSPTSLVYSFVDNTPVSPQNILLYINNSKDKVRLTPDGRLIVEQKGSTPEAIVNSVKKTLRSIW